MNDQRPFESKAKNLFPSHGIARLLPLLPATITCFLLLSLGAAIAIPLWKYIRVNDTTGWWAGALYLLVVGLGIWLVKWTDRFPENRVVAALIFTGAILKTCLVLFFPHLPLNIDQALFHSFSQRLGTEGFTDATLSSLSSAYDYPLWTNRSYPVHYLIQRWAGSSAMAWTKGLNVIAASLILCVVYLFARRLLPQGKRKWPVFLLLILPFQTFWATDYSHHLFSSLYLLIFVWAAWEITYGPWRLKGQLLLSALATVCLLFMTWQRGVDWIAMGLAVLLLVWKLFTRTPWRLSLKWMTLLVLIPIGGTTLLKGPLLLNQIQACDLHRQSSILPGFMARGWCPESGGEYFGRYEQLDRVTPWPQKPGAMIRLVVSQIHHEPVPSCFLLPAVKTAKLFLVGYASNFEESLALCKSAALPHVTWLRLCGTLVFLGFAFCGGLRFTRRTELSETWLPILLVPLLTWGAYVLAGETSPRYSVFCQPFLALMGALVFCKGESMPDGIRTCCLRMGTVVLVLLLTATAGAIAIRLLPDRMCYEDMRPGISPPLVRAGHQHIFERMLTLPAQEERVAVVQDVPSGAAHLSFYPLDYANQTSDGVFTIETEGGERLATLPLQEQTLPVYLSVLLPPGTRRLSLAIERPPHAAEKDGQFEFGYLLWTSHVLDSPIPSLQETEN